MRIYQSIIGIMLLTNSAAWNYERDHPPPDNRQARLRDPKIIAAIERKLSVFRCVGDLSQWKKSYFIDTIDGKSIRNSITGQFLSRAQLKMSFKHEDMFDLVLFNYKIKEGQLDLAFCARGNLERASGGAQSWLITR